MTVSAYVDQDGLKFVVFLSLPPEGWDCRYTLPHPANVSSANLVLINLKSLAMGPMIMIIIFLLLRLGLM